MALLEQIKQTLRRLYSAKQKLHEAQTGLSWIEHEPLIDSSVQSLVKNAFELNAKLLALPLDQWLRDDSKEESSGPSEAQISASMLEAALTGKTIKIGDIEIR